MTDHLLMVETYIEHVEYLVGGPINDLIRK